jgi:transcription elongation factor GreA
MQAPIRKYDKYPVAKSDPHITPEKFRELEIKLKKLKEVSRPREAEEVKRLALMGDFSENAGYQLAKGRLRGINQRILDIEDLLSRAEIIAPPPDNDRVGLGSFVTITSAGKTKTYQILGSAETNPLTGIISHNSPLGAALIGKKVGDSVTVQLTDQSKEYKIIKIGRLPA